MNIVIGGVPFSQNLGDGIIFENIKNLYSITGANIVVSPLDIAGRDNFETGAASTDIKFKILHSIPAFARKPLVACFFYMKYRLKWRMSWSEKLQTADLLTIGGGQLFLDEELNFPLKLYFLSLTAKKIPNLKTVIAFVGVSPDLSPLGKLLFRKALINFRPHSISVRDEQSKQNFNTLINSNYNIKVVPDPGLNSRQCYKIDNKPKDQGKKIGICISNPKGLDVQGRLGKTFQEHTENYFRDIIRKLNQQGYHVSIFTNGASEDELLKDEIYKDCKQLLSACEQKPQNPDELVKIINQYNFIVAHRLHANIIAYSLGITSIGLFWDTKVESFFKSINRPHLFVNTALPVAEDTVELINSNIHMNQNNIEPQIILELKSEIHSHLAHL